MKSSNVLVAFATMGSLIGSSAAIADEKIATATAPAQTNARNHQQICQQQKKSLMDEGLVLKAAEAGDEKNGSKNNCELSLRTSKHAEQMAGLIRECASDFGMSDLNAGKFILQYTYYAQDLLKSCTPH